MGYAILRIAKRKSAGSAAAMVAHALRETAVPNAIEGAPPPAVLVGATTTAEAMGVLKATIVQAKKLGGTQGFTKASTPVLDILVTASHADMQKMSKTDQDNYFKRALKFIAAEFGGKENILTAAIHRDETTPHMQVLVMPFDRTTNRFSASKMIGGPVGLSAIQDRFHADCGAPHGLQRGEKGSKAKHVPVRVLYAQMAKGVEPPRFMEVPAALGALERLKPGYGAKKAENEAARAAAIKNNADERKRLNDQAKSGRMMSPALVERQAARYRKNVKLELAMKASEASAAADKVKAADDRTATAKALQDIKHATVELQNQAQTADRIWTKSGASMIDKWSKTMAPEMRARLARSLNIDLKPGQGIVDQMRAAGKGKTLMECVQLANVHLDGILYGQGHALSGHGQGQIERPKG